MRPLERGVDTRIALRVKRALGLVAAPALEVGATVQPVLEVTDRERQLYDNVVRGVGANSRGAAAGNRPFIGLVNDSTGDNKKVLVVKRVLASTGTAAVLEIVHCQTSYAVGWAGGSGTVALDRRGHLRRRGVSDATTIAAGDSLSGRPAGAGTVGNGLIDNASIGTLSPWVLERHDPDDFIDIVWPGEAVYVTSYAVASSLYASFQWEEYPAPLV